MKIDDRRRSLEKIVQIEDLGHGSGFEHEARFYLMVNETSPGYSHAVNLADGTVGTFDKSIYVKPVKMEVSIDHEN